MHQFTRARCASFLLLVVLALFGATHAPARSEAAPASSPFPIRAAFYYGWFPQAWNQSNITPYTKYSPTLGWYDSGSDATARAHIAAMKYGGIQAGIATWWGQGHYTDSNMRTLLNAAGSDFRWSVYYEEESTGDPSVEKLRADLTYLRDRYAQAPAWLTVDGRFVVFVYADGGDGCDMARRWSEANAVGAYVVLKVFHDYERCAYQPQNWHQYGPAEPVAAHGRHSYTISPGFDLMGQSPRLPRDLTRWRENVRAMASSGADFQLVTTFNEWGEGTSVESAAEWATPSGYGAYLDALHTNGAAVVPADPTRAAAAIATPPAPSAATVTAPAALPQGQPQAAPPTPAVEPTVRPGANPAAPLPSRDRIFRSPRALGWLSPRWGGHFIAQPARYRPFVYASRMHATNVSMTSFVSAGPLTWIEVTPASLAG
jgi:hypothetical protein